MGTFKIAAVTLSLILAASTSFVIAAEASHALEFAKGSTTAKESGKFKGRESMDYTLQGHKGQTLHAVMTHAETAVYFDVLPPGGGEPLFYGARVGSEFTGTLPADGEYTIHVHLAGRDAFNGENGEYTLMVDLGGK